jgi:Helicase associated domain (HA2)
MPYVIALVAALSVHDPLLKHKFAHEEDDTKVEEVKSTGNVGDDAEIKKQKGNFTSHCIIHHAFHPFKA